MAKKTQSYSQVQATDELEQLGRRGTSAPEFVYDLLRIFSGYGDGQVRRTKDTPGILLKTVKPSLSRILSYIAKPLSILLTAIARRCTTLSTPCAMMRRLQSTRHVSTSQATVFSLWPTIPKKMTGTRTASTFSVKTLNFYTPCWYRKIQFTEEAEVDVKSAELMAKLFDDIRRYNDIRENLKKHKK